jgi:hypothetical protein
VGPNLPPFTLADKVSAEEIPMRLPAEMFKDATLHADQDVREEAGSTMPRLT